MPTSNAEELRLFLKCTVIGRGVFGPCACWSLLDADRPVLCSKVNHCKTEVFDIASYITAQKKSIRG